MKSFIFDTLSRRCIGVIEGDKSAFNGDGILIDEADIPEGLNTGDLSSMFLGDDGHSVTQDTTVLLNQAKYARKIRIKQEASSLIADLDWRLERAREREQICIAGVETVSDVLAKREAIRQSSSKAESVVDSLTDVGSVNSFSWSVHD